MVKADLAAAGVPYKDAHDRYADFHALRHTFISNLARAGVHPRNAQALARHSTIDLTMNVYTHIAMEDLVSDIEAMPPVLGACLHAFCYHSTAGGGTRLRRAGQPSAGRPAFGGQASLRRAGSNPHDLAATGF